MSDNIDLVNKAGERVFERYFKVGFKKLSESEQAFLCLLILKGQVDNGGFDQYYYNTSGDLALETVPVLERIGAKHSAKLLSKANNLFLNGLPDKATRVRRKQLKQLTDKAHEKMSQLDEVFYKDKDKIDRLLHQLIVKNAELRAKP